MSRGPRYALFEHHATMDVVWSFCAPAIAMPAQRINSASISAGHHRHFVRPRGQHSCCPSASPTSADDVGIADFLCACPMPPQAQSITDRDLGRRESDPTGVTNSPQLGMPLIPMPPMPCECPVVWSHHRHSRAPAMG